MIIYCIVTAFLNSLAAVVLGTAVIMRAPARKENHLFAWFTATFAIWSIFYLSWQLATTEHEALLYSRALTGASVFIPITYFHFVSRLTAHRAVGEIRIGYLLAAAFACLTFSPYFTTGVEPAMMFPYWPQPGPIFWPYFATFLYFVVRACIVLVGALRRSTHWHRRQLAYVFFGSVAGWLGGLTNFFLWFGIPIPPVGNGLALVYIVAVGYAMLRFRLVDLNVVAVRSLVYLAAIAVLSLIFMATVVGFRAVLPGESGQLYRVADYLGAFVVTLGLFFFVPRVTRWVDVFLEEKALRGITGNPHRLREYIHRVSTLGPEDIFKQTVNLVSEELKVARVEIYCRNDYDADYGLQAGTAVDQPFFERKRLSEEDWLVRATQASGKALVVYEQEGTHEVDAIAACERAGVELAMPIRADRVFYGLLVCGRPKDNGLYSDLDISLLDALCIQIGLTLRARELERRSNRVEKLVSLGTMAAGLAHELRNPLVSIRTFTDLIDEQGLDREFQRQFRSVVSRDVNRIGAIIDQVAAFSNSAEGKFGSVDLTQVISAVQDIARHDLDKHGVEFNVQDSSLPPVRGNYNQLIQVFLNLVQNSIQAFDHALSPVVRISFLIRRREDGKEAIMVALADNGPGIPVGIRPRIFDPFVTTKNTGPSEESQRGMGLGLGIVKSIVEAHGGSIDVATTTGAGTTFYVELLCQDDNKGSGSEINGERRPGARKALRKENRPATSREL